MKTRKEPAGIARQTSILIFSRSAETKVALRKIIHQTKVLGICGEPSSWGELAAMVKTRRPDVLLIDQHTVDLNNMTRLQEYAIEHPVPMVILSGTSDGLLRGAFGALRDGAVDFIDQETLFKSYNDVSFRKKFRDSVIRAARLDVTVPEDDPDQDLAESDSDAEPSVSIVFCEDCGTRNVIDPEASKGEGRSAVCSECGDLLMAIEIRPHKRTHYVTVIGAGTGSYANLLRILPMAPPAISGAIVIVIYDSVDRIDLFTDFLDSISSIKVSRIRENSALEGGNCYVAAASEYYSLKPYSTGNTMTAIEDPGDSTPIDLMLESVSTVFKQKSAGLILSGVEQDGRSGLNKVKEQGGISAVLFPGNCLYRQMGEALIRACRVDKIVDSNDAARFISDLHDSARDSETAF